ncbi:MAG: hypothetical protein IJW13_04590 [Clostridia bacterium]|nr:hypothetical protein [Clostridia bacterium]
MYHDIFSQLGGDIEKISAECVKFGSGAQHGQEFLNCSSEGRSIIVTYDSGWYLVGKSLKDNTTSKEVTCFSFDNGLPFLPALEKLLLSVSDAKRVAVIGNQSLALYCAHFLKDASICFIPTDFNFCAFYNLILSGRTDCRLIIDGKLLIGKKNIAASGVKSILSKNIILLEDAVNRAIGGYFVNNNWQNILKSAIECALKYFETQNVYYIIRGQLFAQAAVYLSGIGNPSEMAAAVLENFANLSEVGEREYFAYKMLVRIYLVYFSNDSSFLIKKGGELLQTEEINRLFPFVANKIINKMPQWVYDDKKVKQYKANAIKEDVLKKIKEQEGLFERHAQMLRKIYAGRKYTVEHYTVKQRALALNLLPLLSNECGALWLVFADGVLEYIS